MWLENHGEIRSNSVGSLDLRKDFGVYMLHVSWENFEQRSVTHHLTHFLFVCLFWLCWVFVAAHGLSLVEVSRGYSLLQCTGFSLWWLLLLRSMGSRHAGFSSCGMQAQ